MTIAIIGKPYRHYLDFLHTKHPTCNVLAFYDQRERFQYPDWLSGAYSLDFSSKESVQAGLEHWVQTVHNGQKPPINGLEATYESGVLPKVWIGEFFGCPTISEDSALAATDKTLMRRRFMEYNPNITPQFQAVASWEEAKTFALSHTFPLILKPANLMKSILVTKSENITELEQQFATATATIAEIYQKHGVFHRKPQLVIEEYLDGPSFSVDCVADVSGNVQCLPVVDLVMARELGIPDNYNYSRELPSALDATNAQAVQNVAAQGVRALGLRNSAAHVEIVLTKSGPKLIEIGARFGGYRPRMYEMSYGIPVHEYMLNLSVGQPTTLLPIFQGPSKVYELFPSSRGHFSAILHLTQIKQLPSFHSMTERIQEGEEVGLSKDGYKFCAAVIIHNSDPQQFANDCRFIEEQVRVQTQEDPAPFA